MPSSSSSMFLSSWTATSSGAWSWTCWTWSLFRYCHNDLEPAAICSTWSWSWRGPRRVEVICSRVLVRKPPRTGGGLALARSPPAQGKGDLQQGAGQVPSGPGRRGDLLGEMGKDLLGVMLVISLCCW